MTCIVAYAEGGRTFMGADSAVSGGDQRTTLASGKVWRNGPMIFGACGSLRHGQLIRYGVDVPPRPHGMDVTKYLATTFADVVRAAMKAGGGMETYYGVEHSEAWSLVGYAGRLFYLGADSSVVESTDSYTAVGSGEEYALGSLHSTASGGYSVRQRLRMALEAAANFSSSVAAPFSFVSNTNKETDL